MENLNGYQAMEKSIEILQQLLNNEIIPNKCQNERYLHHYYSQKIQEHFAIDFKNLMNSKFHPEWPTSKSSCAHFYSKYRKNSNKYIIDTEEGSSAFIDFAIGDYKKPDFAIEFTSKYGLSKEDLIFDFLKLLDSKNCSLKYVLSFNLVYREKELPQGGYKGNIVTFFEEIYKEIFNKENERNLEIDKDRQFLFWIIEINQNGKMRHWILKNNFERFENKDDIKSYNFL